MHHFPSLLFIFYILISPFLHNSVSVTAELNMSSKRLLIQFNHKDINPLKLLYHPSSPYSRLHFEEFVRIEVDKYIIPTLIVNTFEYYDHISGTFSNQSEEFVIAELLKRKIISILVICNTQEEGAQGQEVNAIKAIMGRRFDLSEGISIGPHHIRISEPDERSEGTG